MYEHAADLYLCCACVEQQLVAQHIFKRQAEQVVRCAISRVHRDTAFVRETLQEFWEKLLTGAHARVGEVRIA